MPTVINDLVLEPKAPAPAVAPPRPADGEKSGGPSPEMERKIDEGLKQKRERALRHFAY